MSIIGQNNNFLVTDFPPHTIIRRRSVDAVRFHEVPRV
jgi:hypothetical protein